MAKHGRYGFCGPVTVGRTVNLTPADWTGVESVLNAGPKAYGYATGVWDLPRVTKLVEIECGVWFGRTSV